MPTTPNGLPASSKRSNSGNSTTVKINGVNPYTALKKIFEELPLATTADDYERLANLLLRKKSTT
ncbi:TPA: transposase domain-containing protein [Legionella pneumophila]|nr:transposase domain-containing protein [Legionella pneumophila]HCU5989931.1 transposase domain-containing protein [Legionella pneumophila]HDP7979100.1 transposase domain-containing protein [Legionella pneumophila]HEM6948543.1 transposase domain-containing protein [Legionella pneumophila]HEM7108335.1 transposase domain-containing protein [Legionella pneumophila]